MQRRVLVVTYYFPPAGGPGVQRMLKTVRYLPEHGWTPVVLTVAAGAFPERDPSMASDLPADLEVIRTAAPDPFRLYAALTGRGADEAVQVGSVAGEEGGAARLARWIRANLFLPDARVGWVPFAASAGLRRLRAGGIDALVTSGPPHSVHLTGWLLRRLTGVPWLADLRDPWTDINYYHELPHARWALRVDAALERAVLGAADAVTTVSPAWQRLLQSKLRPGAATPVQVVQNGFDAADFQTPAPALPTDRFVCTHTGSLYASRNPEALWHALARLRRLGATPHLRVQLVGHVDPGVLQAVRRHGVEDWVEHVPYLPHDEAVGRTRASHVLLLSIEPFEHQNGMITGKLYEYLAAARPVLALGPPEGDAAHLLRRTSGGQVFARDDVDSIEAALRRYYDAWAAGTPHAGAAPDTLHPYERRAQAARFADVLSAIGSAPRSR